MNISTRLLFLLKSILTYTNPRPQNQPLLSTAIKAQLKRDPIDAWIDLNRLVSSVEEKVDTTPHIDQELFGKPLRSIQGKLATLSIKSSFVDFRIALSPEIQGLEFVVHQLEKDEFEDAVEVEDLEKIRAYTDSFIDDIASSSIKENFKSLLLRSLLQIRVAIDEYSMGGGFGVRSAVSEAVGEVLLSSATIKKDSDEASKIKTFFEHTKNINALFSLTRDGSKLIGDSDLPSLMDLGG